MDRCVAKAWLVDSKVCKGWAASMIMDLVSVPASGDVDRTSSLLPLCLETETGMGGTGDGAFTLCCFRNTCFPYAACQFNRDVFCILTVVLHLQIKGST